MSYYNQGGDSDLAAVLADLDSRDISEEEKDRIRSQIVEQYYQKGPDLKTFETMLDKLTGSKMKQQGQVASARRGDIYAGGLANMMSNF